MKTSSNYFNAFERENLQKYFDTDFDSIETQKEDYIQYIEQCHFGDMLIETSEPAKHERYKLWRKLDINGGGILIEYCGHANRHVWQTIYES